MQFFLLLKRGATWFPVGVFEMVYFIIMAFVKKLLYLSEVSCGTVDRSVAGKGGLPRHTSLRRCSYGPFFYV